MPELPEVENLRLGLLKKILGKRVKRVFVRAPKMVSGSGNIRESSQKKAREFEKQITGEIFSGVSRRAKNLIFEFQSGKRILAHLKMSGQFIYKDAKNDQGELPGKHTHIIFELGDGVLYYNDIRTFGYLLYFQSEEEVAKSAVLRDLGAEPLGAEFTVRRFFDSLKKKKGKLKAVLLSQKAVVGLGNIYADEVCFAAGVRPTRSAASLSLEEADKLHRAIKKILPRAIKLGGSSISTYTALDESRGNYAREHLVYGRGGEKCSGCEAPLRKIVAAGRTTVFCKNCQK